MNTIDKKNRFIIKAAHIHDNKYDYSLVEYLNNRSKVIIICKIHGMFSQKPEIHLSGCGCLKCGKERKERLNTSNTEKFIEKAILIHGNKFSYEKSDYINAKKAIIIICKKHGKFYQMPCKHLLGHGCQICAKEFKWSNYYEKIFKANLIHHNSYEYDKLSYSGVCKNMNIFCKKHNKWFKQTLHSHLKGYGRPICKKSNGELIVKKWLDEKNIEYDIGKTFENCKYIKKLSFDFYLFKHNILIEYDGRQHVMPVNFGGISIKNANGKFLLQKKRDEIKTKFANDNNIKLIRISHYDNIIEKLNLLI